MYSFQYICAFALFLKQKKRKKEHLFSRIKGCLFIINVGHTKTVFSSLLDEIGWFKKTGSFICNIQYYMYVYTWLYGYIVNFWFYLQLFHINIYYIIYNMFNIYIYIYKLYIYIIYILCIYIIYIYIYIYIKQFTIQFLFGKFVTFGLKTIITVFQICTEILHYLNILERAYSSIINNNTRS